MILANAFFCFVGIVVKDAAKKFGKKFACGSSVIDDNAIEIQGDVVFELMEYIMKEYKDVLFFYYCCFEFATVE